MAGVRNGVLLYAVGHPKAVVAELAPAGISDTIVCANKCE